MKKRMMDRGSPVMTLVILCMLAAGGCGDDSGTPVQCDAPPLSVLSIDVTDFSIFVLWMLPGPDQIDCQVTLRIENTSSKHSYSDVTVPSARVYRTTDNLLLGEIRFETVWDGALGAGEVVTVELTKIEEDFQIFADQCNELLYLDITISSPGYGEMTKGSPTYICSCLI